MKDIVYIVEQEIVDKMNRNVTVKSFVGNTLTVCTFKWARVGSIVEDAFDNTYQITSVDYDNNLLEISPLGMYSFSGTNLILNKPSFFVGTPLSTNREWSQFDIDQRKKVPFVWMVEPTRERFKDLGDPISRESELRIVFLDSNDVEQWYTKDTHDNRLQALYNMVEEFIEAVRSNRLVFFSDDLEYTTKNFTKFGKETTQGVETNIIDANLTGIDLQVTVKVKRDYKCNC